MPLPPEGSLNRFAGKVAVVTGGASGMGRESSIRLGREGASVVVAGLPDDERGAETVAMVEAAGGQAVYVGVDVTREADCDAMADAALEHFGRLDLCIAAAGISHAGYVSGEVTEGEPLLGGAQRHVIHKPVEYWEKVLAVNLTGVMLTNRAVARRMIAQGEGGAIVNISSGAAKAPIRGMADYCVSKTGVWMLTRVLALELAPNNIRVNTVAPGLIDTPMTLAVTTDEERRQRRIESIPLNRLGEPSDIAEAALFLLSDQAGYITGQILHPDGGIFVGN
ncbi:MAG: SDR family oxidoreductase [Chloroflexi bacterium]|nr:SDR family oxidoreductase [Chloroflexota bacterium]MXX81326.1 SDR family oxidoreductase [Chloroflexota bacterium]MYB21816.1 SDR family oxidoreductase [Chloroflexota bacterium]MYD17671.1 SDR family oxidoreductase [Chloroflexota bacterium]MYF22805.1 SDR family oxidoreductase [Chloroflexota bacterium]